MAQKIVAITIDEAELKQLQQAGLNPPAVLRRGLDLLAQTLERQAFP